MQGNRVKSKTISKVQTIISTARPAKTTNMGRLSLRSSQPSSGENDEPPRSLGSAEALPLQVLAETSATALSSIVTSPSIRDFPANDMIECVLGMKDCLAVMESWNLALNRIHCSLSPPAPPSERRGNNNRCRSCETGDKTGPAREIVRQGHWYG